MSKEKREAEPVVPGFAMIARFTYAGKRVTRVDQKYLSPGQGVVFFTGDEAPLTFEQSELEDIAQRIAEDPSVFESLAILDQSTGGLLITQGPHNNFGLNGDLPKGERVVALTAGSRKYGVIWGENEAEVNEQIRLQQEMRARVN